MKLTTRRRLGRLGIPLAVAALLTVPFAVDAQAADARAAVRGGGGGGQHGGGGGCKQECPVPEPGEVQPAIVVSETFSALETLTGSVQCPDGTTLTGGGFSSGGMAAGDGYPSGDNTWTAVISTESGAPDFTVYAICLPLELA